MDPEKKISETIPVSSTLPETASQEVILNIQNSEESPISDSVSMVTESVVGTVTPQETPEATFDPKLLAGHLEENRPESQSATTSLFHQPLQTENIVETHTPQVQVVEKIIYQKQRIHGFFRTLALIALLFVGILMLLEGLKIFSLNIDRLDMNIFYPVFIILSVIVIWSYKGLFGKIFGSLMFLGVVAGFFVISVYSSLSSTIENNTGSLTSFPSQSGTSYSKVYISTILNSLTIDSQTGADLLVSTYDVERPLTIFSGQVPGSHTYAIIQESDKVNLLEGVYTRLNASIQQQQPVYLYVKTLLGQNILDMKNILTRGLRLHGGIVSIDLSLGSGESVIPNISPLLSGSVIETGDLVLSTGEDLEITGSLSSEENSGSFALVSSGISTLVSSGINRVIDLDLQAAVADITLHLPATMGVRMHYKSYIGTTDLPQIIQKSDGTYESKNINQATTVVDINALFGLSKFTILRDR